MENELFSKIRKVTEREGKEKRKRESGQYPPAHNHTVC